MEETVQVYQAYPLVYHYTCEVGLTGILKSQTIRATHYRHLNDCAEVDHMRDVLIERLEPHINRDVLKGCREYPEYSQNIRNQGGVSQVAKFSAKKIVEALYRVTLEGGTDGYHLTEPYIASFSSHMDDPERVQRNGLQSQFDQYGNYAIVFDTKGLSDKISVIQHKYHALWLFGKVVYDDDIRGFEKEFCKLIGKLGTCYNDILKGDETSIGELLEPFLLGVARYKDSSHKTEREVRIVAFPEDLETLKFTKDQEPAFDIDEKKIMEIKTREVDGVPYVELFDPNGALPIQNIIVGPGDDQTARAEIARRLVEGTKIDVICSEI